MTKDKPAEPAIAYTNVTADDWVEADPRVQLSERHQRERDELAEQQRRERAAFDQDAAGLMDLIDQRAADDAETGADGGEL